MDYLSQHYYTPSSPQGTFCSDGIIRPVVSDSELTWFIRYFYHIIPPAEVSIDQVIVIKMYLSNLVHRAHFWNNLHQVGSKSKDWKAK